MNHTKPFYVNGMLVSVHNSKTVKVYLDDPSLVEQKQETIDNIMQYLMDELFVTSDKCKVEIHCKK